MHVHMMSSLLPSFPMLGGGRRCRCMLGGFGGAREHVGVLLQHVSWQLLRRALCIACTWQLAGAGWCLVRAFVCRRSSLISCTSLFVRRRLACVRGVAVLLLGGVLHFGPGRPMHASCGFTVCFTATACPCVQGPACVWREQFAGFGGCRRRGFVSAGSRVPMLAHRVCG